MAILTDEQKKQILEQMDKFMKLAKEVQDFENELATIKEQHKAVLDKLEKVREEEKDMISSFNLDEEGKRSYNEFVTNIFLNTKNIKLS